MKTELRRDSSPTSAIKLREPLQDFTLADVNGRPVKFSELAKGKKLVAINIWATWCAPCRMEMPGFEQLYHDKKGDGFLLIAVSEDEERPKLDAYLKAKPLSFPVLVDRDQKLGKRLGITALPTTILVGADGKVQRVEEGVQPYFKYEVEASLRTVDRAKK